MAVTLTVDQLAAAMRLGDSTEERNEVVRLLAYASEAVVRHAPSCPDVVHDEASIRLISYIFDQPTASRRDAYQNAMRNCGAGRMMSPYMSHHLGETGDPPTTTPVPVPDGSGLRQIGIETITISAIEEWFSTALPYPTTTVFGVSVEAPDGTSPGIVLNLTTELLGASVVEGGDATTEIGNRLYAIGAASAGGAVFFASSTPGAHIVRLFEA